MITVGGIKVVDLVGMKRPFKKLRELDFDEVVKKIVAALLEI